MQKKDVWTKILAVAGTVLVWLPVAAPLLFGLLFTIRSGRPRVDYLMPAELGLVVLAGGLLLVWAALRARSHLAWIAWGLGVAFGLLVIFVMIVPAVTGLASGETQPGGWEWALTLAGLAGYILAVIWVGIGGIRLWRVVFKA